MARNEINNLIIQAQNGDGEACFDLYQAYKLGLNVPEDPQTAMEWLERAIDNNHPTAKLIMDLDLLNSGHVEDALESLHRAADSNDPDAMNVLGQLYLGNFEDKVQVHLPLDLEQGIELVTKAAIGGNVFAQILLGKCFYIGKWVPKDLFLAKYWLEKARDQGHSDAQTLLDEACRVQTVKLN